VSKAICLEPGNYCLRTRAGPVSSGWRMSHPKSADFRKDPSVHAWQVLLDDAVVSYSVGTRGGGELFSMFWPSKMIQ